MECQLKQEFNMQLYDYYRSTASYRVRIALNLKKITYEKKEVHLVKNGGEQHAADYVQINPQHLVPSLIDGENSLNQSLAILEYLEERFPQPALLPDDLIMRSKVRSIAQIIACDIHPLNNLRVLQYLQQKLDVSDEQKNAWYHHWIEQGFQAIEKILSANKSKGYFCIGNTPTIADICLVAQVYNAKRFNCPLDNYSIIQSINDNCLKISAFADASPDV